MSQSVEERLAIALTRISELDRRINEECVRREELLALENKVDDCQEESDRTQSLVIQKSDEQMTFLRSNLQPTVELHNQNITLIAQNQELKQQIAVLEAGSRSATQQQANQNNWIRLMMIQTGPSLKWIVLFGGAVAIVAGFLVWLQIHFK